MSVPVTLPFTLTNNTLADATQVMADFLAITSALSSSAAASGVNSDITSLNALTTPLNPGFGGTTAFIGATSTGPANAQAVTPVTPNTFVLTTGYRVVFIAGFTNTGAMTLNVRSTGATPVNRMTPNGPQALTGGEVVAGNVVEVVFDGAEFQLITTQAQFGGFGSQAGVTVSGGVADIGAVLTHSVQISGTGPITSFGSSASATYPFYLVEFASSIQLNFSGSFQFPGGSVGAGFLQTRVGDWALAFYAGGGNWIILMYQGSLNNPPGVAGFSTRQVFTAGTSLTYTAPTLPVSPRQLRIRMIGGGGGGNGGAPTAGGQTSFAGVTANGGTAGVGSTTSGLSGNGSGAASLRIQGGSGQAGGSWSGLGAGVLTLQGGGGAASPFAAGGVAGLAPAPNSGAGGNGAPASAAGAGTAAGGGGAGEYVELVINAPLAATYTYTVGAGGTAGAAVGASAGAAGIIVVDEIY